MRWIVMLCVLSCILGCTTKLSSYKNNNPKFLLEAYFSGEIVAYGVVQDYKKKLTRHFCVEIAASWEKTNESEFSMIGVLDEKFIFDDLEKQTRIWTIKKLRDSENQYVGEASDVVGLAKGKTSGNVFRWQYVLQVPINDDIYDVVVDDWIYLLSDTRVYNRSLLKKFGIKVGEITLFFEKEKLQGQCTKHFNL